MGKTILLLFVSALAVSAQPFSFGLKAGVPLADAFTLPSRTGTGQFIIGPQAELRLPFGIGVEADLLYTRLNFSTDQLTNVLSGSNSNSFEFPILVKYRFSSIGPLRPFVGAGPSFRRIQSVLRFDPKSVNDAGGQGVVIGGGVELKLLFLRISPELRYTHWGAQNFQDGLKTAFQAKQSEGQFLVGFSF
jgi:hypothetical protein